MLGIALALVFFRLDLASFFDVRLDLLCLWHFIAGAFLSFLFNQSPFFSVSHATLKEIITLAGEDVRILLDLVDLVCTSGSTKRGFNQRLVGVFCKWIAYHFQWIMKI